MTMLLTRPFEEMSEAEQAIETGCMDDLIESLSPEEKVELNYRWAFWRRPNQQIPEGMGTLFKILYKKAGRGFGKALDIDTPIPTPTGWTTMGELKPGDAVFDETGKQTSVLATYDQGEVPGWELVFSDGSTLVACDEHLWVTLTRHERKQRNRHRLGIDGWQSSKPLRTADLVATIVSGNRGDTNHAVPLTGPLDCPVVDLPIDPYTLGVWLGDGHSAGATITCHIDDEPHYRERIDGWRVVACKGKVLTVSIGSRPATRDTLGRMTANGSLHSTLRLLGLLHNKHVPVAYLRASASQRLALLQGLLDTDGSISKVGRVEFGNTNLQLATAVVEIARTLGQKPTLATDRAKLNGRDYGPRYRVAWRPTIGVVTLPRKATRLRSLGAQGMRSVHRMVVSATRIEPRRMCCITVDSPSSLYLAGEGMIPTHNTRMGAETTRERIETCRRIALMGPSPYEIRAKMIEGESGILSVFPPHQRPFYEPSLRQITFHNGAIASLYSAAEPDLLRNAQHEWAWVEEPASMPKGKEALDNLLLGLRLGRDPWVLMTGTPKPRLWLKEISKEASTLTTGGSTYENAANLAPSFLKDLLRRYEGTRLGRQELHGDFIDDNEGALWTDLILDRTRMDIFDRSTALASLNAWLIERDHKPFKRTNIWRTIVAVDPPGETAECGIIVATAPTQGRAGVDHAVILEDASIAGTPEKWGRQVASTARRWGAERIYVESNQGGDMCRSTIHAVDPLLRIDKIHARISKGARAEPVSALYERGLVHHAGFFPMLEDQMTTWIPKEGKSPDRLDALVHAVASLLIAHPIAHSTVRSAANRRI